MARGRSIAITAAVAGALAAPLALGASLAQADEAADLRANQELLQRRLDQLSQAPVSPVGGLYPGGPPAPTAGAGLVGGSFPRSMLIPGTDTSIRIGGEIRETLVYWFTGGNPNGSPQSTGVGNNGQLPAIPLHVHTTAGNPARSRGNAIFQQSPRESKLNVETRTPSAWGEARTFMEFDWAGSNAFAPGGGNPTGVADNLHPRLRYAYGTLGGFLAGQANSNFSDPDANTETIDFAGDVGSPGVVRIPQVRYTMPLAPWGVVGAFSMSAETPETDAWLPSTGTIGSDAGAVTSNPAVPTSATTGIAAGSNTPATSSLTTPSTVRPVLSSPIINPLKSPTPDLTWAWYIPQPWGHMDYSFVLRPDMQVKDGRFIDRSYVGYGVHFGGDVKPGWFGWERDYIVFQFVYGDGIGRYLNQNGNFALITNYPSAAPTTAAAAASVLVRPTVEWGGQIGYQHRWSPTLRSNITGGVNHHDINTLRGAVCAFSLAATSAAQTGGGGCGLNKELVTAHANLIWNPVPFVTIGAEYVWGHRLTVSNLKGDENTLIGRFGIRF